MQWCETLYPAAEALANLRPAEDAGPLEPVVAMRRDEGEGLGAAEGCPFSRAVECQPPSGSCRAWPTVSPDGNLSFHAAVVALAEIRRATSGRSRSPATALVWDDLPPSRGSSTLGTSSRHEASSAPAPITISPRSDTWAERGRPIIVRRWGQAGSCQTAGDARPAGRFRARTAASLRQSGWPGVTPRTGRREGGAVRPLPARSH